MTVKQNLGLHNLVAARGTKPKKRVGRGESSGHGKTSGRGHKGQKARKSGNVRIGFEGGQVPLARRLPKRGFSRDMLVKSSFKAVNLDQVAQHFQEGVVDLPSLIAVGLVRNGSFKVKILGNGELKSGLTFKVHAVSESAKNKIEKAGGSVELLVSASV